MDGAAIAAALGTDVQINGAKYNITVDGTKVTLEADTAATNDGATISAAGIEITQKSAGTEGQQQQTQALQALQQSILMVVRVAM